jgi:hypothetical protein
MNLMILNILTFNTILQYNPSIQSFNTILQYNPLLCFGPTTMVLGKDKVTTPKEVIALPGVQYLSNAFRNLQVTNKLRLKGIGSQLAAAVRQLLEQWFTNVTSERPLKSREGLTEVDVVLFEGGTLYLLECKHSVPAARPYELGDLWRDIKKAAAQLQLAARILQNPEVGRSYLAGWFPGAGREERKAVQIRTCILCSHLEFGGYTYQGIPVRDYSSFSLMFGEDPTVSVGIRHSGRAKIARFGILAGDKPSKRDLDDYLSPQSKYFSMLCSSMRPVSHFRRFGKAVLGQESFLYALYANDVEHWCSQVEACGFRRLPDEETDICKPWTFDELDNFSNKRTLEIRGANASALSCSVSVLQMQEGVAGLRFRN